MTKPTDSVLAKTGESFLNFSCCGGNDDPLPGHTMDCSEYPGINPMDEILDENKRLREALEMAVTEINRAIPLIRKWTNINSVNGPDLQDAGNILSCILSRLPKEQNQYLERTLASLAESKGEKLRAERDRYQTALEECKLYLDKPGMTNRERAVFNTIRQVLADQDNTR